MRILAFGEHHCHMLATSMKEVEVDFFWTEGATGFKAACEPVEDFGFRQARALKRRLRKGDYDLILCEAIRHPVIRPGAFLAGELVRAAGKIWRKQQVFGPRLLPWLVRGVSVPLAVIDRSDNPLIGSHNFPLLACCQVFFKRELPVNRYQIFLQSTRKFQRMSSILQNPLAMELCAKLHPISLGLPPWSARELPAPAAKEVDVFAAVLPSPYGAREQEQLEQVLRLAEEGYRVDILREKVPVRQFLERCAQARLVWSPQGVGWECWRHYEAAAVGSVPVINYPGIVRFAPLVDGEHAVFYAQEGDGLLRALRWALNDKARLDELGEAARAHARKNHTQEKIGDYLIETLLRQSHLEHRQNIGNHHE